MERLHVIEELQESIAADINVRLQGTLQEVLVEGQRSGKLHGRTRTNKIAHFSGRAQPGDTATVLIEKSSAWSLQGRHMGERTPHSEGHCENDPK